MTITKRRPRPRFLIITIIIRIIETEAKVHYNNNKKKKKKDNRDRGSLKIYKNSYKDYKITRKKELLVPRLRSDKVYPY